MIDILQLSDLEFQSGRLVKVKGFRHNYMSGDELIKLVQSLAALALRQRAPWDQRMFFPIVMPLDKEGRGPASEGDGSIYELTWEVWDQNCQSYGSFRYLNEAVLKAEELNDKFGDCLDEGCPHYGTPHTHYKSDRKVQLFRTEHPKHSDSNT